MVLANPKQHWYEGIVQFTYASRANKSWKAKELFKHTHNQIDAQNDREGFLSKCPNMLFFALKGQLLARQFTKLNPI